MSHAQCAEVEPWIPGIIMPASFCHICLWSTSEESFLMKSKSMRCPLLCRNSLISWGQLPWTAPCRGRGITTSTFTDLRARLIARAPVVTYDYLTPTPSHLLNLSLADVLPPACYPANFKHSLDRLPLARHNVSRYSEQQILPQGHHLVYFAPQTRTGDLLDDGTDTLHWPGPPFARRLWAGGSLTFHTQREYQPELHGARAVCVERIVNVRNSGSERCAKIHVEIERQIAPVHAAWEAAEPEDDEEDIVQRLTRTPGEGVLDASIVETRNIVFLSALPKSPLAAAALGPGKVLTREHHDDHVRRSALDADGHLAPQDAGYRVSLTPTAHLLFRFSALTFNAHAIHLDRERCQAIEGHRDLLVHGPLTLTLMLSVLRSQLAPDEIVQHCEYRNLAPLYLGEELTVCVKQKLGKPDKWDVWIEGSKGQYAVKATAQTASIASH